MQVSNGERLHIGIFGRVNSGKSSLLNALSGQNTAIVSDVRGTTTDPVYKPMEINGLGAVRLIDTAGVDDASDLGELRNAATDRIIDTVDVAVLVCGGLSRTDNADYESMLIKKFKDKRIPFIIVNNVTNVDNKVVNIDFYTAKDENANVNTNEVKTIFNLDFRAVNGDNVTVNAKTGEGIDILIAKIKQSADVGDNSILQGMAKRGDTVILVMPQDESAPKGRLILPQVRAIRELLDIGAAAIACIPENLAETLNGLKNPPALVITDSQAFGAVASVLPNGIRLTSFSVLLSAEKGDITVFTQGAAQMDKLNTRSRVLIAEACAHVPQNEDIGRVKIPAMLKKIYGVADITHCGGNDFPQDLTRYDLIIHCGACMFNRRLVMSRVRRAVGAGVPITNYGIALAKMQGILDRIVLPIKPIVNE